MTTPTTKFYLATRDDLPVPATDDIPGVLKTSTPTEVAAGLDDTEAVTPLGLKEAIKGLAPKESPSFTGTPKAPTPGANPTDLTQLVNIEWVAAAIAAATRVGRSVTADYTLVVGDANGVITSSGPAARKVVIPSNTAAAIPLWSSVNVFNLGPGALQIIDATEGGSVVVESLAAYESSRYVKIATNQWSKTGAALAVPDGTITAAKLDPALLAAIQTGGAQARPLAFARVDAAIAARATKPMRIGIIGSSTPANVGATVPSLGWTSLAVASYQAAYPSGLGKETAVLQSTAASFGTLSTAPGIHAYNAAEGGTTSATFLTAAERTAVAQLGCAMIWVQVTANDFAQNIPPATSKANLLSALTDIRNQTPAGAPAPVFVLWHGHERYDSRIHTYPWSEYARIQKELADADPLNFVFKDVSAVFYANAIPGDPAGAVDTAGLMAADKIHLDNDGHALMAKAATRELDTAVANAIPGSGGGTVTPPAVYKAVIDSVARPNNTSSAGTADSGQSYSPVFGTWGVVDGAITMTSGTNGVLLIPVGAADQSGAVDVQRPSSGVAGVRVRADEKDNGLSLYFDGTQIRLGTVIGGSLTVKQSAAVPSTIAVGAYATLKPEIQGRAAVGYVNGTALVSVTLTDAELAALTGTGFALRQTVANASKFRNLNVTRIEPALLATDTFTRANTTGGLGIADSGQAWVARAGVAGITNGKAVVVSGSPQQQSLEVGQVDVEVTARVGRTADGFVSIYARGVGLNERVAASINCAANTISVSTTQGGTSVNQATSTLPASWTAGSEAVVKLRTVGDLCTILINDVAGPSFTLTAALKTTLSTGTQVGWRTIGTGAATATVDEFTVTRLVSSAPPLNAITQPPLGDEPGWKQIIREGFDTDFTSGNFRTAVTQMSTIANVLATGGGGIYRDSVASASGSELILDIGWDEATQEFRGFYLLPAKYRLQKYGRFDMRIRMPDAFSGWKGVVLWYDNGNDWQKGEIDPFETGSIGGTFKFYTHVVGDAQTNADSKEPVFYPGTTTPVSTTNYITVSGRWTPTEISVWVDGQKAYASTDQRGFPQIPMRLGFQFEYSSLTASIPPAKTARGKVYIDWFNVYDYDPTTAV